jgi:hypothetical protein
VSDIFNEKIFNQEGRECVEGDESVDDILCGALAQMTCPNGELVILLGLRKGDL